MAEFESPTGCLLGACSGLQPVGLFSLLTLLFSGALTLKTQAHKESFAKFYDFYASFLIHYPPISHPGSNRR
jgi:hypothetical protein